MQLKEFDILLDVKKHNKIEYIEVVQGDFETNILNIKLTSDLKDYNLTDTTVEIAFSKSDGTTVIQDQQNGVAILNETEGKIQCILNTNTIASPGRVNAEVRVLEGARLLTSSRFEFWVRKSLVNDEIVESTNEFPLLQRLTDDVQGVIATEADRVDAENARQTNEDIRVANEIDRVQAEQERAATFEGYEERVSTVEDDLAQHKLDYMPHRFQDIKNNNKYNIGFQISEEGNPQIIFEEVM